MAMLTWVTLRHEPDVPCDAIGNADQNVIYQNKAFQIVSGKGFPAAQKSFTTVSALTTTLLAKIFVLSERRLNFLLRLEFR